jgi:hypothetical protein
LTDEVKAEMLAGETAFQNIKTETLKLIEDTNKVTNNLSDDDKNFADILLNKDYNKLSLEEIINFQSMDTADFKEIFPFLLEIENADELLEKM